MSASTNVPSDHVSIIGRERERSGLGALLDRAAGGAGSLVLVGGHAGIGKTTLVRDLEQRARSRGLLVLTGYCYDVTATQPYGPWTQGAAAAARVAGLPPPPASLLQADALAQSSSQQAIYNDLEAFLLSIADQRPLLLILEDLHWSDRESLAFLRWFGHSVAQWPILIAATYRDDELTRHDPLADVLPALVRESGAQRITLRPLTDPAIRSLVDSRYELSDADEARLIDYLRERTGGNPFFLGEMLRALEEEQRLVTTDGITWTIADLDRLSVPPLVRQVIDRRINRLGKDVRTALDVASVLGQDVPLSLWSTVAGLSEEALIDVVRQATSAHLIVDARDGSRLRFTHVLVRDALYEGLLLPQRRQLHRRVAETLINRASVTPETIAYHLREAGDPRAIDWSIQAGVRAERVAWLTAAEHFNTALALMHQHDTDPAARGWLIIRLVRLLRFSDTDTCFMLLDEATGYAAELGDEVLRAYVDFCRAEVDGYAGKLDTSTAMRAQAHATNRLRHLPAAERERLDALIQSGQVVSDATFLAMQVAGLSQSGHPKDALDLGLNITARKESLPAEAPWGLAVAYTLIGDLPAARAAYRQTRDQFIALGDYPMAGSTALYELTFAVLPFLTDDLVERAQVIAAGEDSWNRARGAQGNAAKLIHLPVLALEGAWQAALDLRNDARSRQMTFGRRAIFLTTLGQIAYAQGNTALAWSLIRHVYLHDVRQPPVPIVHLTDLPIYQLAATLSLDAGDRIAARGWLEAVDAWLNAGNIVLGRAENALLWATWHRASGDHDAAHVFGRRAMEAATTPRQPLALLRTHRFLGELQTAARAWTPASEHLQCSLELAEACHAPFERALTLLALAQLHHHTGQSYDAISLINDAREVLTTLHAIPALTRLNALAADLPDGPQPANIDSTGLTTRECDVLRLVADGLTNAEVAERLFVSRRTVDQHLRSIYGKLGVSSRAAATRFAVEHGLV